MIVDSEVNKFNKGHSKQTPPKKIRGDTTTVIKRIALLY